MDDPDWMTLETFLLGTTNLLGGIFYLAARSKEKMVKNLQDVQSVDVGPALKALVDGTEDKTIPYVAINGKVKELGSQVINSGSGLKGVLQVVTVNEHSIKRHASGAWGESVREIVHTQNEVPFGLKGSSRLIVEVKDPFSATQDNLLKQVSTEYSPTAGRDGVVSHIVGFLTGSKSTGIETTEQLLPIESSVTAVGKVFMSAKDKYILMANPDHSNFPYVLTTSIRGVVQKIQDQRQTFRVFSWIFFTIGVAISARKVWKYWKEYEEKRLRERTLRQRRELDNQRRANNRSATASEPSDPTFTCVVCLENPREVILLPCGHLVCCFTCESHLNSKCPVCRCTYTDTHVAYIA